MPVPFLAAILAAPVAMTAPASLPKDAASARAFLQSLYRGYRKDGPGAPLGQPGLIFEPVLAAAVRKDADEAAAKGDMSKMDVDPICACQDWEAITPSFGPVTIEGDRATVTVSFVNFQEPVKLHYTLLWTRAGWRVFDIGGDEGATFRSMYLS